MSKKIKLFHVKGMPSTKSISSPIGFLTIALPAKKQFGYWCDLFMEEHVRVDTGWGCIYEYCVTQVYFLYLYGSKRCNEDYVIAEQWYDAWQESMAIAKECKEVPVNNNKKGVRL